MRMFISVLALSLILIFSLFSPAAGAISSPPSGASWLGDVNDDGSLNVFDLLALLKLLSGSVQPEAIYWGPPALAEVTPAHTLPGETVTLTFRNLRDASRLKVFLRGQEQTLLSAGPSGASFTAPDSFFGGSLTVLSGADTLGSRFLNLRNDKVHTLAGCRIFPADNPWNQPAEGFPVHALSDNIIKTIGGDPLHPDMISGDIYGMPYNVVGGGQPLARTRMETYPDESDPGPFPVPDNVLIEGGPGSDGDRHSLILDSTNCILYELGRVFPEPPGWRAGCGAIFDLNSNSQRPDTWTSVDAAGLAILPGVVQYDEVAAGEVNHAIRFTVERTRREYVYPASHYASRLTDQYLPPMGLRVRLKKSYNIARFSGQARVIARALQKYGMILADNGGNWYFTGGLSRKWNGNELDQLKDISGTDFEVVDCESMVVSGRGSRYNIRPFSDVTSPAPGAVFAAGMDIPVRVEASDNDGTVARVEFFAGNILLGIATAAPYEFIWKGAPSGTHVLSARSTDNGGVINTSWGITITVQ